MSREGMCGLIEEEDIMPKKKVTKVKKVVKEAPLTGASKFGEKVVGKFGEKQTERFQKPE